MVRLRALVSMLSGFLLVLVPQITRGADPVAYFAPNGERYLETFKNFGGAPKQSFASLSGQQFVLSPDGSLAYVAGSNNIEVVEISTGSRIASYTTGAGPHGLTLKPDGSLLYDIDQPSASTNQELTVISTVSGSTVATAALPIAATTISYDVAVTPDGSQIYVSSYGPVIVISGATYQIVGSLSSTYNPSMAVSAAGDRLYLASHQNDPYSVSVVDTASNQIIAYVPDADLGYSNQLTLSADGAKLFDATSTALLEISTATNKVTRRITGNFLTISVTPDGKSGYSVSARDPTQLYRLSFPTGGLEESSLGGFGYDCKAALDGSTFYALVAPFQLNTIDTVTKKQGAVDEFANIPYALTLSASGNTVAGIGSSMPSDSSSPSVVISALNRATGVVTATQSLAPPQYFSPSLAINRDGTLAFTETFNVNGISVINLATGTLQQTIAIPGAGGSLQPDLAVSPDDSTLYVLLLGTIHNLCAVNLASFNVNQCVTAPLASSQFTRGLAVSADGSKIYAPNRSPQGLAEYDSSSLVMLRSVGVANVNQSVLFDFVYSQAGNSLYFLTKASATASNQGVSSVGRIDLGTFTVAASTSLNYVDVDLAVTPDGTQVYVTGSASGVQVFDGTTLAPVGHFTSGPVTSIVIAP